ncbi:MAG TPA: ribose 5-phosphate isomerase B [Kofleriaceae bacterium]|nr:ribose 5-phosphate isomerase B [Kofleriaceae bacterium]
MKWYAGADHAGRRLKDRLVEHLRALGDQVEDLGTGGDDSVDYPDFAALVGARVAAGDGLGLLVCGTGTGMAIAANKVAGVRAAVATDAYSAALSRSHNDANVLALGERVVGIGVAESAVDAFRGTAFEGGRHARRVAKITALERRRPDDD